MEDFVVVGTLMDEKPKLPVTVAVTPEPLPPTWDDDDTFQLARELAVDHTHESQLRVLERHNITMAQFATLASNELFRRVFDQLWEEWNSIQSTEQRIRHRSRLAVEAALPELGARMLNNKEPLASVAQMAKVLTDIGALAKPDTSQTATAEKITISIDLGADNRLTFNKEKAVVTAEATPLLEPPKKD